MQPSDDRALPVLRLLGPSGSGKTTLGERLIETLSARGYRVATIKSAHRHPGPADRQGSDTARFRAAGAAAGAGVFADGTLVTLPHADLDTLLTMLRPLADLVLVEGFRDAVLPTLLFVTDEAPDDAPGATIARIVRKHTHEQAQNEDAGIPTYERDDVAGVAAAVERWLREA